MVRVKRGYVARRRRKKLLKRAKGFRGSLGTLFRLAKQAVIRAGKHARRARRVRKRDMRSLWIVRISAAAKEHGTSYSRFMNGLKKAGVGLDRKSLAEIAASDPSAFARLVDLAKPKHA